MIMLLFVFSLALTIQVSSAQEIMVNRGNYSYKGNTFKNFKSLSPVLAQNEEAYEFFSKAESSKRGLYVSLGIAGASFIGGAGLLASNDGSQDTFPSGELVGAVLCLIITVVSGVVALFQLDNMTYRRSEAVGIFNDDNKLGWKQDGLDLKIGFTSSGLGLVFEF